MKRFCVLATIVMLILETQVYAGDCLFAANINLIISKSSPQFKTKDLGVFVKVARSVIAGEVVKVRIFELTDRVTGELYHLNYTEEDQFDGGNAIGWIESLASLKVVATISDSTINSCKIKKTK